MILASEDGTLEALKFSLASDLVELVILTTDEVFLKTLRAALGDARRLWHVPSADKVSDLLLAGQVGILVLDAQALLEAANSFVEHIKRQFPDLVVVAAGHRDDETALAGIISSGLVYRFIHKPMSPARARLFAEAAIRKYQEQRRRAAESPRRSRAADPSRIWLMGAAVAATVIAVIAVFVHRTAGKPAASIQAAPVNSAETAEADQAEVHEKQLARAENAFLEQLKSAQLKAAQSPPVQPVQPAQPSQPAHSQQPRDAPARPPAEGHFEGADGVADRADVEPLRNLLTGAQKQVDVDAWSTLLRSASERLLQDRLTEPENDNAKYFYLTLKQLDPSNAALSSLLQDLGTRLTAKARRALTLGQSDAAKTWLDEAGAVGFSSAEVSSAQHDLAILVAQQNFMANLVPSSQLKLLKSVQPVYPFKAQGKAEGWVDVEFTVAASGKVQDVAVHAASIPGTFDEAAVRAVSKWIYQPVLRDAKPVAVRTQIRIRFSLS